MNSLDICIFTSRHYWWKRWEEDRTWLKAAPGEQRWHRGNFDTWHIQPDKWSNGGTGFALRFPRLRFGIHMVVHWGGE